MRKQKLNQSGFGTVEVILLIIIVGLLGAVGWFVYDRSQNNEIVTQTNTATTPTAKTESTENTNSFKNEDLGLSLNYPDEWGTTKLSDGELLKFQSGKYKELTFSKSTKVSINFVTGAYSSPLDACGYDDPIQNAQHGLNADKASVIGWNSNNVKRYMTGQGFNGPSVYLVNIKPGDTGAGWTKIATKDKVLVYKDIDSANNRIEAGSSAGCNPVTQAQADAANAFLSFYHYAANYKNDNVYGVNAQFDARKADDPTTRSQLIEVLNSIK